MTAGDLIVGAGTLALAIFTARLSASARDEGRAVKEQAQAVTQQVELQFGAEQAAIAPFVIPAPEPTWAWSEGAGIYADNGWRQLLPVKNAGPGAALNVHGALEFGPPSGLHVPIISTSLAGGDRENLRLHWEVPTAGDWSNVQGWIEYEDISGRPRRTEFKIRTDQTARYVEVDRVLQRSDADEWVPAVSPGPHRY